jgi:hypothetical protein
VALLITYFAEMISIEANIDIRGRITLTGRYPVKPD